ncbi:MAG: LPS-assembly protein LptD [Terriglobales bacterium]
MNLRTRIVTVVAVACHLFLALLPVTSQTPVAPDSTSASAIPGEGEPATLKAKEQEKKGNLYYLHGEAEVDFRDYILRADEIAYDAQSTEVTATGHVTLDGGRHDDHIEATDGQYNLRFQTGTFHQVAGTVGVRYRNGATSFTSSNPIAFTAKTVHRQGQDRYIIEHGTITSCKLPNPKWTYSAGKVIVDVGDKAKLFNSVFHIRGVPVFYFPFAEHPIERLPRQSGFLIPSYGNSSRKGTVLGDSFYWAINRSMDAAAGGEYYSKRGWGLHSSFRARPSKESFFGFGLYEVFDKGEPGTGFDQGGREIRVSSEAHFDEHTRLLVAGDYLSSFVFRLAFVENFTEVLNSEVRSTGFISRNQNGYSLNMYAQRYQNFQSTLPNDNIQILHVPSLEFASVDRQVGNSKLFWNFDAEASGLARREPLFATADYVGRIDFRPEVSLPLAWHGWTFRPSIGVRETYYSQRLEPNGGIGKAVDQPVNRHDADATVELRPPALSRIFTKKIKGRTIKHTIEPRVIYNYVRGIDNFPNVIRFDSRDILSDTNEVEYGVINRIYAKGYHCDAVPQAQAIGPTAHKIRDGFLCGESAREIITWELAQKYFIDRDFGGALFVGRRNVFSTTEDLTGIAFLTGPRNLSPIVSRLRVHTGPATSISWNVDYDPVTSRLNASSLDFNHRVSELFFNGGLAFLRAPGELFTTGLTPAPNQFSQYRGLLGYGHPDKKGLSAAITASVDAAKGFIQGSGAQGNYNWDCCGVSVEYRRNALGPLRTEDQFRFNFTLINIGAFGSLQRNDRIF